MSIAGGSVQERKMAVELRLDPVNPCGGALGAICNGDKACSVRELHRMEAEFLYSCGGALEAIQYEDQKAYSVRKLHTQCFT